MAHRADLDSSNVVSYSAGRVWRLCESFCNDPAGRGVQEFTTPMAAHIETALRSRCHLEPCLSTAVSIWSRGDRDVLRL